jgi:hypothetical protein
MRNAETITKEGNTMSAKAAKFGALYCETWALAKEIILASSGVVVGEDDIGIGLMLLEENFGEDGLRDIKGFVRWAREDGRSEESIASTLIHDIFQADKKLFLPRTHGYRNK